MKIVSFITAAQRDVIDGILTHGDLASRAPPSEARAPLIRELTSLSDLEFVDDPQPAELVGSAD